MAKPGIKKTGNAPKQGISWTPLGEIDFTASQEIDLQSSYANASHKFKLRYFVFDQPTVKVPERVRFCHENVQLSAANHSFSWKKSGAVIGLEVYIFMPKSYRSRNFDGGKGNK